MVQEADVCLYILRTAKKRLLAMSRSWFENWQGGMNDQVETGPAEKSKIRLTGRNQTRTTCYHGAAMIERGRLSFDAQGTMYKTPLLSIVTAPNNYVLPFTPT